MGSGGVQEVLAEKEDEAGYSEKTLAGCYARKYILTVCCSECIPLVALPASPFKFNQTVLFLQDKA